MDLFSYLASVVKINNKFYQRLIMDFPDSYGFGFCTARYTCKSQNNKSRTLMYPYNDEIH